MGATREHGRHAADGGRAGEGHRSERGMGPCDEGGWGRRRSLLDGHGLDLVDDGLDDGRVGERRQVAQLVGLVGRDLAQDAPHCTPIAISARSNHIEGEERTRGWDALILPERVLGRSGTMTIALGAAKGPMFLRGHGERPSVDWMEVTR